MARTSSGTHRRRKILIIEDYDETRLLLGEHFTHAGYHVETASEGNAGIAAALALQPDVIVLDLAMPRLDGWDTVRILRSYPTTTGIPVIACTAMRSDEMLDLATALGCNAVVRKPCVPMDVEQVVDKMLEAPESANGGR
ncbi:MAG TPA: response regulator [Polyangiaceae bacterium]